MAAGDARRKRPTNPRHPALTPLLRRPGTVPPAAQLLAQRVYAIGVERLWYDDAADALFVSLDNRTYHSVFGPVPPDRVAAWLRAFDLAKG